MRFTRTTYLSLLMSKNYCLRCMNSMFSIYFHVFRLLTEILNFLFNEHKQHAICTTEADILMIIPYFSESAVPRF